MYHTVLLWASSAAECKYWTNIYIVGLKQVTSIKLFQDNIQQICNNKNNEWILYHEIRYLRSRSTINRRQKAPKQRSHKDLLSAKPNLLCKCNRKQRDTANSERDTDRDLCRRQSKGSSYVTEAHIFRLSLYSTLHQLLSLFSRPASILSESDTLTTLRKWISNFPSSLKRKKEIISISPLPFVS